MATQPETDLSMYMRALVAYNEWADGLVLTAASSLDDADLDREASFGTIRANLAHMLTAQRVWLSRWTGQPVAPIESGTMDDLRAAYGVSHTALREFISSRTAEQFRATVDYRDSHGDRYERPLWVLITHVVNHGTHHRAETGLLLASQGRSPGDMDFVLWARDHGL